MFDKRSIWRQVNNISGDSKVETSSVLNLYRKCSVVPVLVTEDDLSECISLALDSDTDTRMTFPQFLYGMELIADRLNLKSLDIKDIALAKQQRLPLLINIISTAMFKANIWARCSMQLQQLNSDGSTSLSSNEKMAVITVMQTVRQARLFSLTQKNIVLHFRASFQSMGHLIRIKQFRFVDTDKVDAAWKDFYGALLEDIAATIDFVLPSSYSLIDFLGEGLFWDILQVTEYLPGILFVSETASENQLCYVSPFFRLDTAEKLDNHWEHICSLLDSIIVCINRVSQQHEQEAFPRKVMKKLINQSSYRTNFIGAVDLRGLLFNSRVLKEDDQCDVDRFDNAVAAVCSSSWRDNPLLPPLHFIETIYALFKPVRAISHDGLDDGTTVGVEEFSESDGFFEALQQLRESVAAALELPVEANADETEREALEDVPFVELDRELGTLKQEPPIAVAASPNTTSKANDKIKNLSLDVSDDQNMEAHAEELLDIESHRDHVGATPPVNNSRHSTSLSAETLRTVTDMVRLLMHFPSRAFAPTPWQVYHLHLEILGAEFAQHPSSGGDKDVTNGEESSGTSTSALVIKLLTILAERYSLSPAILSTFFATYYMDSKDYASFLPAGAETIPQLLQSPFMTLFCSENVQRLLALNEDLLKWEYTRCISCCRNSKEPFTQMLMYPIMSQSFLVHRRQSCNTNMLVDFAQAQYWMSQYSSKTGSGFEEESYFPEYVATAALSGLQMSVLDEDGKNESPRNVQKNALPLLTFSTFVIFAVRCFTKHMFQTQNLDAESVDFDEQDFLCEIRNMLKLFSANLTMVQRMMELHVLEFLFEKHQSSGISSSSSESDEDDNVDDRTIAAEGDQQTFGRMSNKRRIREVFLVKSLTFAKHVFDQRLANNCGHVNASTVSKTVALPPRPPSFLWDAARFVDFVRYFHLTELAVKSSSHGTSPRVTPRSASTHYSMTQSWACYGIFMWQEQRVDSIENAASLESSLLSDGHIPPLPLQMTQDKLWRLLELHGKVVRTRDQTTAGEVTPRTHSGANDPSNERILSDLVEHDLFPLLCAFGDSMASGDKPFLYQSDSSTLEDLIRFGGSATMNTLSELQGFLQLSFYCLARSSEAFLYQASQAKMATSVVDDTRSHGSDGDCEHDDGVSKTLEIPINVACEFFSCQELIGAAKVAFLAKESLHHRLRPPYALSDPSPNTNNHTGPTYRTVVTMNYAEFEELFLRAAYQIAAQNAQRKKKKSAKETTATVENKENKRWQQAYEVYQQEERRLSELPRAAKAWGRDFLSPYAAILQQYFKFPVEYIDTFQEQDGFNIPSISYLLRNLHASALLAEKRSLERSLSHGSSEWPAAQVETAATPLTGNQGGSFSSASSPSVRRVRSEDERLKEEAIESIANNNYSHIIADPVPRFPLSSLHHHDGGIGKNELNRPNKFKNVTFADDSGAPLALYRSPTSHRVKAFFGVTASEIHGPNDNDPSSGTSSQLGASPNTSSGSNGSGNTNGTNSFASLQYVHVSAETKLQLIHDIKEALWPVFATYCSCGDSLDPGKLSGPNLFTLLSKLGLLDDYTLLSDIGRIFYRICSRSFGRNAATMSFRSLAKQHRRQQRQIQQQSLARYANHPHRFRASTNATSEDGGRRGSNSKMSWSPAQHSLIFEEFLIFLFAFAQLRYEERYDLNQDDESDATASPSSSSTSNHHNRRFFTPENALSGIGESDKSSSASSATPLVIINKKWQFWYDKMTSSVSFQRLFHDCIVPVLQRQTLLAFPEDARYRDRFTCVFSYDVLEVIERVEGPLAAFFTRENMSALDEVTAIVSALRRIDLLPKVISEKQVVQLVKDVLPEDHANSNGNAAAGNGLFSPLLSPANGGGNGSFQLSQPSQQQLQQLQHLQQAARRMVFPQWMWVLCIVAFQAVRIALYQEHEDLDDDADWGTDESDSEEVGCHTCHAIHFLIHTGTYC